MLTISDYKEIIMVLCIASCNIEVVGAIEQCEDFLFFFLSPSKYKVSIRKAISLTLYSPIFLPPC